MKTVVNETFLGQNQGRIAQNFLDWRLNSCLVTSHT